jgi:hypothetical protein
LDSLYSLVDFLHLFLPTESASQYSWVPTELASQYSLAEFLHLFLPTELASQYSWVPTELASLFSPLLVEVVKQG